MIALIASLVVLGFGIVGATVLFWLFLTKRIPEDEGMNYAFGGTITFLLLILCVVLVAMTEKQYYHNLMH